MWLAFLAHVSVKNIIFFPSHKVRKAALICISLALNKTPVYTARQCIAQCACLRPQLSLVLISPCARRDGQAEWDIILPYNIFVCRRGAFGSQYQWHGGDAEIKRKTLSADCRLLGHTRQWCVGLSRTILCILYKHTHIMLWFLIRFLKTIVSECYLNRGP